MPINHRRSTTPSDASGPLWPTADAATIERIARAALESPDATLLDHTTVPLEYDAYLPGRTVFKVEGSAAVDGARRTWAAIRKWTDSPARTPSAPAERGRREALAYDSGLLSDIAPLRAPRALSAELRDDGSTDLWIEDVGYGDPVTWDLATYGAAARALGGFNGRWIDSPLPAADWLVRDWAARQSEPVDMVAAVRDIEAAATSPRAAAALGQDIGRRARRMLEDQPGLIALLGALPQVLCHHDAARSNLVARQTPGGTEVVAFDWELTGPGAVGADIATLVSGSARKGDVPAALVEPLDAVVFEAYVAGLREAGWHGDARVIRLGYAASLALRCWLVRDTLRNLADPESRPMLGRASALPPEDALSSLVTITAFLVDRAEEARRLSMELGIGR
jgi:hypothetical protein